MKLVEVSEHFLGIDIPDKYIDAFSLSCLCHLATCGDLSCRMHSEAHDIFLVFVEELLLKSFRVHLYPQSRTDKHHLALIAPSKHVSTFIQNVKITEPVNVVKLEVAFRHLIVSCFVRLVPGWH